MPAPKPRLTECPRDALQGLQTFVPTEQKVAYLTAIAKVGFDVIDFGSFVSPKAVPQLRDTAQVLAGLLRNRDAEGFELRSELLAIVLNERGTEDALAHAEIAVLGFPWSISETFQQRNANQDRARAWAVLGAIAERTAQANRRLRVYLSMAFGNPYGDAWHPELVAEQAQKIADLGVADIALADTVGAATPAEITPTLEAVRAALPNHRLSAHFHATPTNWHPKLTAAASAGVWDFDSALGGFGGCPFAQDALVGNLATENLAEWLTEKGFTPAWSAEAFGAAQSAAKAIFGQYA